MCQRDSELVPVDPENEASQEKERICTECVAEREAAQRRGKLRGLFLRPLRALASFFVEPEEEEGGAP